MLLEISEIHKLIIKKLQGPEKALESISEHKFYLDSRVESLRDLLKKLDKNNNSYSKRVFLEIHQLELEQQEVELKLKECTQEMLRTLNHFQQTEQTHNSEGLILDNVTSILRKTT